MVNARTHGSFRILCSTQIRLLSNPIYVPPGKSTELLCISRLEPVVSSVPFTNIAATIDIHSNMSYFNLPIYLYNGHLSVRIAHLPLFSSLNKTSSIAQVNAIMDHANGGIRRNETNPFEYLIASTSLNASRTVKFVLVNTNPIDIAVEEFNFTFSHGDIELDSLQALRENDHDDDVAVASTTQYKTRNISQVSSPPLSAQRLIARTSYSSSLFLPTIRSFSRSQFVERVHRHTIAS